MATQRNQRGTTLIELITVISILGVIASVASVFIRGPIDAYVDSTRRAGLTDSADTAMRRIARDIRKALPNSTVVRNSKCLEFIPTKTAGRYRAVPNVSATANGDILNFVAADPSFNMMGLNSDLPADQQIKVGDVVAVYNLGARAVPGADDNTGADAYTGANTSLVSGVSVHTVLGQEATINIDPPKLFPLASGSKRFYVIPKEENIVAYACTFDSNGVGNLRRMVRSFDPDDSPDDYCRSKDGLINGPILASNVSSCKFEHDDSDLQRNEPVRLTITFTDTGESISLYHQVSENNWP
jgi:MSHA biogenesis protein MshO